MTLYFLMTTLIIYGQHSFTNCQEAEKMFKFNSRSCQTILTQLLSFFLWVTMTKKIELCFSGYEQGSKKAKNCY